MIAIPNSCAIMKFLISDSFTFKDRKTAGMVHVIVAGENIPQSTAMTTLRTKKLFGV